MINSTSVLTLVPLSLYWLSVFVCTCTVLRQMQCDLWNYWDPNKLCWILWTWFQPCKVSFYFLAFTQNGCNQTCIKLTIIIPHGAIVLCVICILEAQLSYCVNSFVACIEKLMLLAFSKGLSFTSLVESCDDTWVDKQRRGRHMGRNPSMTERTDQSSLTATVGGIPTLGKES